MQGTDDSGPEGNAHDAFDAHIDPADESTLAFQSLHIFAPLNSQSYEPAVLEQAAVRDVFSRSEQMMKMSDSRRSHKKVQDVNSDLVFQQSELIPSHFRTDIDFDHEQSLDNDSVSPVGSISQQTGSKNSDSIKNDHNYGLLTEHAASGYRGQVSFASVNEVSISSNCESPSHAHKDANSHRQNRQHRGGLTKQQAERRNLRRIFQSFDEDGSGSIDVDELREVMKVYLGHEMNQVQLQELVMQVDSDGTGELNFDQFVHLCNLWKEVCQFNFLNTDANSEATKVIDRQIERALEPHLLLPDSQVRDWFNLAVFFGILYNYLAVLYFVTLDPGDYDGREQLRQWTLPVDIFISVIFFIELCLNFVTAVIGRVEGYPLWRVIRDDYGSVLKHRLTSPFFYVDLCAVLPLHRLLPDLSESFWWYCCVIVLLKTVRMPYLFSISDRRRFTPKYVKIHLTYLPRFLYLVYFLMFVHTLAVIWTLIDRTAVDKHVVREALPQFEGVQPERDYTNSLYLVLATLTTCGYGDVQILGDTTRVVVACVICVFATLLNGLVIGSIVSTLSKTDIQTGRANKLRETLAVCEYFEVPKALSEEILNFQNHVLSDSLDSSYQDLVKGLPEQMQSHINLCTRVRTIAKNPLFNTEHPATIVAIAGSLCSRVYRPEEFIVIAGDLGDTMYFIIYGFVDVVSRNGRPLAILSRGDVFGEGALLSDGRRWASVKAITYCDMYLLSFEHFCEILRRFPAFRARMHELQRSRQVQRLSRVFEEDPLVVDADTSDSISRSAKPHRSSKRPSSVCGQSQLDIVMERIEGAKSKSSIRFECSAESPATQHHLEQRQKVRESEQPPTNHCVRQQPEMKRKHGGLTISVSSQDRHKDNHRESARRCAASIERARSKMMCLKSVLHDIAISHHEKKG